MTARFKGQSEYQKSFGVRSRSVSPQRNAPFAGLRSDQMGKNRDEGISREPRFLRRRKAGPLGVAASSSSLLRHPDVQLAAHRKSPPAAHRNASPPPAASVHPEPETPAAPQPAAKTNPEPAPVAPDVFLPPESKVSSPSPAGRVQQVDRGLQWRAGLRGEGRKSAIHRSEYHKQFGWKNLFPAASPLLTAEQVLFSSGRSVPPYKSNPVPTETEYRRSFRHASPTAAPRPQKHPEQERIPLFHTQKIDRKTKESPPKKAPPHEEDHPKATPPPPHRNPSGGERPADPAFLQMRELREKARSYRHRAWGTNFSRVHLGQLRSEHNTLWEPSDSHASVEALDLTSSGSSKRSSFDFGRKPPAAEASPAGDRAEPRTAWEEDKENTDEEDGRLPTPHLRTRPVQRTHHDLTTPTTGGAMLVGNLTLDDASSSPPRQQRRGSSVSAAPRKSAVSPRPSPEPPITPPSEPVGIGRSSRSAPLRPALSAVHGIQGAMRHPDFQHNGDLGLRFRERPCLGGGCGSDEDDRLSVMSMRSAASCTEASALLERAQKRRGNFWEKS